MEFLDATEGLKGFLVFLCFFCFSKCCCASLQYSSQAEQRASQKAMPGHEDKKPS